MKFLTMLVLAVTVGCGYSYAQDPTTTEEAPQPSTEAPAEPAPEVAPEEPALAPATDSSVGLGKFLLNKGLEVAKHSQPSMMRDFVNNEWLYGALYRFYESDQMLPKLVPLKFRDKLNLPPVSFSAGLMAPVSTNQGTPVIEASMNLTPVVKKSLLWALRKLPANLDQHLGVITDALQTDAEGSGILSLGGAGGRDFSKGIWRAGLSMHLAIKFGSMTATKEMKKEDNVDRLLSSGSDSSSSAK